MDEDSLVEGMKELMPVYCVIGKIPVCRTDKIPLGTKGRTSILSIESSASCGASFSVSRKRLHDRACFVTSFRQGGYTPPLAPLKRLSPVDLPSANSIKCCSPPASLKANKMNFMEQANRNCAPRQGRVV